MAIVRADRQWLGKMAKESALPAGPPRIESLIAGASAGKGAPPVHLWNPPFCGAIDMRIARDGTWHYGGTPIGRPALVRLFASILRRDAEGFVLVTPVEKVGILVEDAPFVGVELASDAGPDGALRVRTNVDDWVALDDDHPLRFEPGASGSLKPYARVRGDLWALLSRPVFYELMALGETRDVAGVPTFGIASGPAFFPMMEAAAIEARDERVRVG